MDIVFSKWASNIACKKLRQALGTLHILKVLQKRLQTAYSTAVSAKFEQKRRIQELESEILAERATLAERKRQHTKAGQAMEASQDSLSASTGEPLRIVRCERRADHKPKISN